MGVSWGIFTYCTAQRTLSSLLGKTMMEYNIRKGMCMYVRLGYFAVQQKLVQHCKSTLLLKICASIKKQNVKTVIIR